MTTPDERLARLEARFALRELVARYALAVDDKNLAALGDLFTTDACFSFASGLAAEVRGRAEILRVYAERLALMRHTYHVVHDQILSFPPESGDVAHGLVTAHAEMWRNDRVEIAAIRYQDSYRHQDECWRISAREVSFFYYLPASDYLRGFGDPLRLRAGVTALAADFPESTTSWSTFWDDRKP